jgi:hypothetical protein
MSTASCAARLAAIFVSALAGCAAAPELVPHVPPAAGSAAELTVKTERMFTTNRVTLYLQRVGKSRTAETVGQLQSGDRVRREILSFDARLPAGEPLVLNFEYRYDVGSLLETGCNVSLATTLEAGRRYLIDFIKNPNSCGPRFYERGANDVLTELPVVMK